jgi:hypothetical protein
MLELICNAVWLMTGAVLIWRFVFAQQTETRLAIRAIAVICLILVLFPVISVSDDLSLPEAMLIDLGHSGDQATSGSTLDHTGSVAVALASAASAIRLQFLHFAEPAQQHDSFADAYFLSTDALRAPPAVL